MISTCQQYTYDEYNVIVTCMSLQTSAAVGLLLYLERHLLATKRNTSLRVSSTAGDRGSARLKKESFSILWSSV